MRRYAFLGMKKKCAGFVGWMVAMLVLSWAASSNGIGDSAPTIGMDPRVEVMSTLCYLAGNSMFSQFELPGYKEAIDKHFAAFKDHPAVKRMEKIGGNISQPMDFAVVFADRTTLQPLPLKLPRDLELQKDVLDFMRVTKFTEFLEKNKSLAGESVRRLEQALSAVRWPWFEKFFGVPSEGEMVVVTSLLNGPMNFGPHTTKPPVKYSILGVQDASADLYVEVAVHEFCHSFANPLVDSHRAILEPAAKKLFAKHQTTLRQKNGCNNPMSLLRETFTRATSIQYLRQHADKETVKKAFAHHAERGFPWLETICLKLDEYEANRAKYKTLQEFLPELAKALDAYAHETAAPSPEQTK